MSRQAFAGWAALAAVIVAVTLSVFPDATRGPSPLLLAAEAGTGAMLPGAVAPAADYPFDDIMAVMDDVFARGIRKPRGQRG